MPGMLYVCATPIGNLEDITLRVLRVLKEVDFIAAEDTRHTQKLLNYYDIKAALTSYHEHNKKTKGMEIIKRILNGETAALVTDAGMPGISDPGEDLIRLCYENGIEVTVCPGACASVMALVLSGLPTRRFCFEGFLPTNKKERKQILDLVKAETRTIIFYEAPHRLLETMETLYETLGNREATVLRELTKQHETIVRGTLSSLIDKFKTTEPRGEIVLVIHGVDIGGLLDEERAKWLETSIKDHVSMYIGQGMSKMDAMKKAAKDRGVSKSDIYKELIDDIQ